MAEMDSINEHGGARPGSGRKRKLEKHAGPVAKAEKKFADKLPLVADALLDLALGIMVQEETRDGVKVYSQPPDRQAGEYVLNRIMGKPKERQEVTGKDGGPVEIKAIDYRTAVHALKPGDDVGE